MKKRIRLTESELTNLVSKIMNEDSSMMMDKVLVAAKGMNEAERGGWKKLIKECIAEFDAETPGFSRNMRSELMLSGLLFLYILGAILLDFDIAAILGGVGEVMLADDQIKKWKKVIECAKNKKNGTSAVQESRMKKSIRLTESELVDLVQKIIKEDEMGMSTNMGSKEVTLAQLGIKETSYMVNLKGTTPFYVNGREQKQNINIKPTDRLSSKGCMVDFVGNKTNRNFTLVFDNDGKATIRK